MLFIERFRALSQAPILILTGYGTEELAIRALRAKAGEYLATQVGLSERQLRRRFLDAYGKAPRRCLTDLRMERAGMLLRTTDLPILRIARAVVRDSVPPDDHQSAPRGQDLDG